MCVCFGVFDFSLLVVMRISLFQAYQVELESLAVKLEEENDKLLKEKVL